MTKYEGLRVVWLEAFVQIFENDKKRMAAAQAMGIDQGTVTKHVQKLERWLGRCLLIDDSVPAKLSPDGEEFLPVARQILEMLDKARRSAVFIETTSTPLRPDVSAKHIKVPALRQTQEEG